MAVKGHGTELFQRPPLVPDAVQLDVKRLVNTIVLHYDFAVDGGAVGTINFDADLPANCIVTGASCYDVNLTFTTASADSGTIALQAGSDTIIAAVAVSDGGNPWDAGAHAVTTVNVATGGRLNMDIAVAAVTAGEVYFVIQYAITGA